MTNSQILNKAYRITASQTSLWSLGIFLSSGFNLHFWFALYWFQETPWAAQLTQSYAKLGQTQQWLLALLVIIAGLVIFNYIKILFLSRVHSFLHSNIEQHCILCGLIKDKSIHQIIMERKALFINVILVSFITIVVTVMTVALFNTYSNIVPSISGDSLRIFIMLILLIIVLVAISLWNLFTVLFMLFHGQNFTKAISLSLNLLVSRFWRIVGITLLASLTLLFTVVLGAMVIRQITDLLNYTPLHTWYFVLPILSTGLLMAWLILNNIWFNVVMVIFFDELVNAVKDNHAEKVVPVVPLVI